MVFDPFTYLRQRTCTPGANRTKGTTPAERVCAGRGDVSPWGLSAIRLPTANLGWTMCEPSSAPSGAPESSGCIGIGVLGPTQPCSWAGIHRVVPRAECRAVTQAVAFALRGTSCSRSSHIPSHRSSLAWTRLFGAEAHPDPCSCFRLPGDPATPRAGRFQQSRSRQLSPLGARWPGLRRRRRPVRLVSCRRFVIVIGPGL